ncbi:MAG: uncharacterized protein PWQ93_100 [Clostridiales bacterium]|nr:uncharacterized protein [Clostridiales bacterium]
MNIESIAEKFALKLLILFGSYGTDRCTPDSDIDLAFLSRMALSTDEQMNLINDLVAYFKSCNIDLVDLARAEPLLLYQVAKYGRVIFGTEIDFIEFKCYASFRYADTAHLRRLRRIYLDEQIKALEESLSEGRL